ncbi:ATP-binding cassette domain-containing protein [Actinomadura madurae]|uniref:ABC transporter ATP-binding protein n=1 Tax=Actinomadura madurae TaxID=1993 RepID=UPI002026BA6D|nr:oligopeptide/dipeptide ABC transporter ATP-binding protein [Actinomadura madurae]URM93056.1 ATP-binding cassette domain-containing protein [Actinomadura madurae]URN03782.1 ATP-binding cassette domain-containing protein [Actinomadura madurae]
MTATAQDTEVVLRVSGLEAGYERPGRHGFGRRRVPVVAGIDLAVRAGRTLGVVGESGCGKSTLARAIVGLRPAFAGTIEFAGADLAAVPARRRRRTSRDLQMVFQDPYTSLNPRMTVAAVIAEGWRVHPGIVPREREDAEVARLLDLVGLSAEHGSRHLHELSGGQCQRVGIARALALRPKLIVCDEAVSALDVSIRAQILNLLADLQSELGVAYLFISHDLDVVRHIAHDVAVMYLGTIVERGTAAEVFGDPQHPYTRALLSAAPSVRDRPDDAAREIVLRGEVPSPAAPPSGCRFRTRCYMAAEVCEREVPGLVRRDGLLQEVACHFADTAGTTAPR